MLATIGAARAISGLSPALAAVLAERVWMTPGRHATPERELLLRRTATPMPIPWDKHALRGWSWGRGPTVLLVHGWEGRGTQLGALADPLVAAGFRVVTFDAPAHGESGGRHLLLPRFADAVSAAARAVGPLHAVVAHSFGAAATGYALRGGLTAGRAVFVSPMDPSTAIDRFTRFTRLGSAVRREMEARLERRFGQPLERFGATELAIGQRTPLLVVHDADDPVCPPRDGEAWVSGWPDARLVGTRGLGHARILRDPAVVGTIVDWLREPSAVAA